VAKQAPGRGRGAGVAKQAPGRGREAGVAKQAPGRGRGAEVDEQASRKYKRLAAVNAREVVCAREAAAEAKRK
jgi:hypothetical protein